MFFLSYWYCEATENQSRLIGRAGRGALHFAFAVYIQFKCSIALQKV